MRKLLLSALLLLLPPSVAAADVCDDVAAGADTWETLADTIDGLLEQGGPNDAQAAALDRDIAEGVRVTLGLTEFLIAEGNGEEQVIGQLVQDSLRSLERAETFDQSVDQIDDVIDARDGLLDGCVLPSAAVEVVYEPPADPALTEIATAISGHAIFEEVATYVTANIAIPRTLPIRFTACGEPNAYYSPDQGEVIMCYELLALARDILGDAGSSAEEIDEMVLGSGIFFLIHELGHALVHQLELPIAGREEDAVDGLATVILVEAGAESDALAAVDFFAAMARFMEGAGAGRGPGISYWGRTSSASSLP
ncbi:MAG: DUF4344 domain-containing metallopeptidase [Thermoanaerobaculia bacterium]